MLKCLIHRAFLSVPVISYLRTASPRTGSQPSLTASHASSPRASRGSLGSPSLACTLPIKMGRVEECIMAVRTEDIILWADTASAHQRLSRQASTTGPSTQWSSSAALRWPRALTLGSGPWVPWVPNLSLLTCPWEDDRGRDPLSEWFIEAWAARQACGIRAGHADLRFPAACLRPRP
jgi:hypothetical protein